MENLNREDLVNRLKQVNYLTKLSRQEGGDKGFPNVFKITNMALDKDDPKRITWKYSAYKALDFVMSSNDPLWVNTHKKTQKSGSAA